MDETDGKSTSWIAFFPAVLLMASVLYVLSVGPAAMVVHRLDLSDEDSRPLQNFYWPLQWLHDNTSAQRPLDYYCRMWGGR